MADGGLPLSPGVIKSVQALENGDLILTALGVVFSKEEGDNTTRDVHGQYFPPIGEAEYYIGDERDGAWLFPGKAVDVLWDHGLDPYVGTRVLGKAIFNRVDEEGLEFLIHIEREKARKYRDLIEAMYNEQLLGVSTQTIPSMAAVDEKGAIRRWGIGELSLTVTPAEPRTIERVRALAKSILGDELDMSDKDTSKREAGVEEQVVDTADANVTEESSIVAAAKTAVDNVEARVNEVVENAALQQALSFMKALDARLKEVEDRLDGVLEAQKQASDDTQKMMKSMSNEIGEALSIFAERLGETLARTVAAEAQNAVVSMSDSELSALKSAVRDPLGVRAAAPAPRAGIPNEWPGTTTLGGRHVR